VRRKQEGISNRWRLNIETTHRQGKEEGEDERERLNKMRKKQQESYWEGKFKRKGQEKNARTGLTQIRKGASGMKEGEGSR